MGILSPASPHGPAQSLLPRTSSPGNPAGFQLQVSPVGTAGPWRDQTNPGVMEAAPEAKGGFGQGRAGPSWLSPQPLGWAQPPFLTTPVLYIPFSLGIHGQSSRWAPTSTGLPEDGIKPVPQHSSGPFALRTQPRAQRTFWEQGWGTPELQAERRKGSCSSCTHSTSKGSAAAAPMHTGGSPKPMCPCCSARCLHPPWDSSCRDPPGPEPGPAPASSQGIPLLLLFEFSIANPGPGHSQTPGSAMDSSRAGAAPHSCHPSHSFPGLSLPSTPLARAGG